MCKCSCSFYLSFALVEGKFIDSRWSEVVGSVVEM